MSIDIIPSVRTLCYANGRYLFCTDNLLCQWTIFLIYGLCTMPMECIPSVRTVYYANGLDSFDFELLGAQPDMVHFLPMKS